MFSNCPWRSSLQRRIIGNDIGFSTIPAVGARLLTSCLLVSLVFSRKKMFNVSFPMLKTYHHALFNIPKRKPSNLCADGFLFLLKPLRTPRKFGRTLLFCCIWAIFSRPMSSCFRGHFSITGFYPKYKISSGLVLM